jgi:hypothetical protein
MTATGTDRGDTARQPPPLTRLFVLSVITVVVLLAAAPVIVTSALSILGVESTTPIEWVPESFAPRRANDQFTRGFESGDVVVASWPGCPIGAPAIDRFIAAGPRGNVGGFPLRPTTVLAVLPPLPNGSIYHGRRQRGRLGLDRRPIVLRHRFVRAALWRAAGRATTSLLCHRIRFGRQCDLIEVRDVG